MKQLIKPDDVATVQSNLDNFKSNYTFAPHEFPNFEIFAFDKVQVTKSGDDYYIYTENLGKEYLKSWNKDVGKILCKALQKKKYDLIYDFITDKHRSLLRLVPENEKESFLPDFKNHFVKFGDNEYLLLKMNDVNVSYASKPVSLIDDEDIISDEEKYEAEEDDNYVYTEEPEPESYSLF